jgi:hypothetical protein
MARFKVGPGFFANFDTTPIATADGDVVFNDAHLIRIAVDRLPDAFENYIGDFEYPDGLPLGTVTEFRLTSDGRLVYRIASADIDVLQLREIAGLGDPAKFLEYIFRDDDRFVGNRLDDAMDGYAGDDVMRGRQGDDRLKGMAGDDRLFGGPGRDRLLGGTGDDWLNGGKGRDCLTGGPGSDTFVFREAGGPDKATDFGGDDRIALAFFGLGPPGALDPCALHLGGRAETPEQRVLYDSDTGWLRYAADGSDTEHPTKVAYIGRGLCGLDASDFLVL